MKASETKSGTYKPDGLTVSNLRTSTPRPWHVYRGNTLDNVWSKNRTVAAYPQGDKEYGDMAVAYCDYHTAELAEANAELIVRAVNAHDEMLAVLKMARVVLKNRDQSPQEMGLLDFIKLAIAKAEAVGDRTASTTRSAGA